MKDEKERIDEKDRRKEKEQRTRERTDEKRNDREKDRRQEKGEASRKLAQRKRKVCLRPADSLLLYKTVRSLAPKLQKTLLTNGR